MDKPTSYEKYIDVHSLPRVEPKGGNENPDEPFFIRTHQVFEIWFSQVLSELEFARDIISRSSVAEAEVPVMAHHIRRCALLFDVLREHLPILETLRSTDFFQFRRELFGATGGQSIRFFEVECLLGLLDEDLFDYVSNRKPATDKQDMFDRDEFERESLGRFRHVRDKLDYFAKRLRWTEPGTRQASERLTEVSEKVGSLRSGVMKYLSRTPYPAPESSQEIEPVDLFRDKFQKAFRQAYQADEQKLEAIQLRDKINTQSHGVGKREVESFSGMSPPHGDSVRAAVFRKTAANLASRIDPFLIAVGRSDYELANPTRRHGRTCVGQW